MKYLEYVAAVIAAAVLGLRGSFGGRPEFLLDWTGLVAAGSRPAVDPRAGSPAIVEDFRASMAGRSP